MTTCSPGTSSTSTALNTDQLVLWNTFLQGGSDVAELTKGLQEITDKIANDDSIKKVEVK